MNDAPLVRRHYSPRRLLTKLLQFVTRHVPFPGRWRGRVLAFAGVDFADVSSVVIGRDVYLDDLYPEGIRIGRRVRISEGVRVLTHFLDTSVPPFRFYRGEVVIEDEAFIGLNAAIVKPVRIGRGAVVAANALVTRDVPANAIVMGNPARVVGYRAA